MVVAEWDSIAKASPRNLMRFERTGCEPHLNCTELPDHASAWAALLRKQACPRTRLPGRRQSVTEPGGGMVPGPVVLQVSDEGSAVAIGVARCGGSANAGLCRSSMSSIAFAFASRNVSAGRFHFVSTSFRVLVWSKSRCET